MLESDAKKLWCPFVRTINADNEQRTNRGDLVNSTRSVNCIGKSCMAWFPTASDAGRCLLILPPK